MKMYRYCLLLFVHCVQANIYTDFITDFVKFETKSAVVTEFSCRKKDSFILLKNFMKIGYQSRSLLADPTNVKYEHPQHNQIYLLNLNCVHSYEILSRADELQLFLFPYKWILFFHNTSDFKKDNLVDKLQKFNILVDSDVSLCILHVNNVVYVKKIFKYHVNRDFKRERWGYWTKNESFVNYGLEKNFARRRNDLMGIQLNTSIVITNNDTYNHLTDKRNKHIDSITKVNYVLVEHLSDIVNVTLIFSVQGTWGYKINTSLWSGMMGELIRREADIGGTPLFFTIDRVDLIDYIAMTTPTRSKFVFREPKLSYVTNVFTLPFNDYVWASTLSLVIITTIVLYIILKWEWKKKDFQENKDTNTTSELKDSLYDAAFFSFGAFCQQGAPSIPLSIPGRITTIMLFLSLMFLYTSYAANIVALLQSSSNSIQTLEDLLKSRLDIGVDDNVFNHFYFPNATEPIRRAIYLQKVSPAGKKSHFMTIQEGVRKMRQGLFAFHMETGPGYQIVGETFQESEKCGLKEIQYLEVSDPWLAVQKNSSYKKLLKIGLRKIQESGLQTREVSLIYTKKPICVSRGSSFISVGIVDCYPAAVVLAMGLIVSVIILMIEILTYHRSDIIRRMNNSIIFNKSKVDELPELEYPWPYMK